MTPGARILSLIALAAALPLSSCGGTDKGEPIPQGTAALMERQLDAVQSAADDNACDQIGPRVSRLQTTIANLGSSGVGDDVQNALADGADNLRSLATSECQPEAPVETTPEETTPEPTATVPEPTTTTPTTTTPQPTTPEPTTPEPLPEPDEGGGGVGPPGQQKKQEGGG